MKRVTTFLIGVGMVLEILLQSQAALAASAAVVPNTNLAVLIVGLQTSAQTSASAEFVRLANTGQTTVDMTGWQLKYKSATGTTWTRKAAASGQLVAGSTLLFATTAYATVEGHQNLDDGLADAGGHLELLDANGAVTDLVGWGNAVTALGLAAPAPTPGQSLMRKQSQAGSYLNTKNNAADFSIVGQGGSGGQPPEAIPGGINPVPNIVSNQTAQLYITELFPNPVAPQTDARDEFIELYNPGTDDFNLAGYKLQTGSKYSYSHTFLTADSIPASSYKAFLITQTKTTLSNDGGQARLLNQSGATVSEVSPYQAAANGQAWALIGGVWQWTLAPTPSAPNVLLAPDTATKVKSETSAATSSKSITTSKPAASVKTTTPKATTAAKKASTQSSKTTDAAAGTFTAPSPIHPLVLAGVGGAAVAYACYEYRNDIGNRVRQLRGYLKARRTVRSKA